MSTTNHEKIRALIPLWYATQAWAKELLIRSFQLNSADEILQPSHRGAYPIPGTNWHLRTHGIGVDIHKAPHVGGIDFDFDKPDPDPWRLKIFFFRLLNDNQIPYSEYQVLANDDELLERTINEALHAQA